MLNPQTPITDRIGVTQCEQAFLKLGWLFRDNHSLTMGLMQYIKLEYYIQR